ncbi:efflux RND transporter periplasmic adaptor subunit [Maribellus sediminis]|uniref:efflux RND transporter periplasmic adaptor subunit n=1 Tax=Maribellus sediminis TaxID=2696285 RepID=UPI0014306536|nr:efflux RND transporter periplasmic adaptor subunit [Maribellus sediminis]
MHRPNFFRSKFFFALFAFVIFVGCENGKQNQMPPAQLKVVEVVQKDIIDKVDFVGEVYGYQDISIRARVPGFLEGIHFREGFPVKKGQLLYTIDQQTYRAEVAAKQSQLAEAKSRFAKAQSDLERYKPLAETNAVSQADLDAAQLQYEAAQSMVEAAEANLEISQINLSYTQVKSPIDGIIGKSLSKVGELVGQAPHVMLNTVSKIDEIFVEFFLPENQYLELVKKVTNGEDVFDESRYNNDNLELVLADGSIHDYTGHVTFIDRGVNSSTGTILIQTVFENPQRIIRPGQYAKVRIPVTHSDALIIPQQCVKELQGQYSVFVVTDENKIETRFVSVGTKIGDLWLINSGLNAGDKVVLEGIQKVRNGMVVSPVVVEFESQVSSK